MKYLILILILLGCAGPKYKEWEVLKTHKSPNSLVDGWFFIPAHKPTKDKLFCGKQWKYMGYLFENKVTLTTDKIVSDSFVVVCEDYLERIK